MPHLQRVRPLPLMILLLLLINSATLGCQKWSRSGSRAGAGTPYGELSGLGEAEGVGETLGAILCDGNDAGSWVC